MSEKLDRRKKYTRMVLKDSLISLLKQKQISAITVKELCQVADVNRSTFYAHFTDPYDLLHKIEEEFIADMYETLCQYNFHKEEESLQMTVKILEYVATKHELCHIFLSGQSGTAFQQKVMEITEQFTMKNWMEVNVVDDKASQYISLLVVSGCIHVIKSWLDNGMDKSTTEMAELINQFTNKGLASFR
ncbi:TetR-like C-terminal domain-containing protein [Alkalihalobacillus sp. LMS39]|uniref:TetR/AcrR family transcriptional regulator n=1 Tax=Alkalihalobacillus sp. LMS39 TaxID=2924032 RepID=UPI001FB53E9C|nr:TetR-like C-terminal domain-containing protein [Alkalihalobacillus sp. LMS39]UOE94703.1 TetR/AcrR family transcriptional regulator [Alkalihalobacillus sp. LMS39]